MLLSKIQIFAGPHRHLRNIPDRFLSKPGVRSCLTRLSADLSAHALSILKFVDEFDPCINVTRPEIFDEFAGRHQQWIEGISKNYAELFPELNEIFITAKQDLARGIDCAINTQESTLSAQIDARLHLFLEHILVLEDCLTRFIYL